jgi:hypothetical protein
VREKIDTKKTSKLAKEADPEKIKKVKGGNVIGKTLSEVKKKNSKKGLKNLWIEHTDHDKTYTEHTKHGKQA